MAGQPTTTGGTATLMPRVLLAVAGVLAVLMAMATATFLFGSVGGEEFSPETFRRRSFSYYEVPLLKVQVWPIQRTDHTGTLENYLAAKPYFPIDEQAAPSWDLVMATRAGMVVHKGDASILCAYLDMRDAEDNLSWLQWTQQHTAMAEVLWPAVARVARQRLYILVPDLIQRAQSASEPDQLQQELDKLLAGKYRTLAELQQELGRHERAVELFSEALRYEPQSGPLLRGRAQSIRALEES